MEMGIVTVFSEPKSRAGFIYYLLRHNSHSPFERECGRDSGSRFDKTSNIATMCFL